MTKDELLEQHYIACTDLARVRDARKILSGVLKTSDHLVEAHRHLDDLETDLIAAGEKVNEELRK